LGKKRVKSASAERKGKAERVGNQRKEVTNPKIPGPAMKSRRNKKPLSAKKKMDKVQRRLLNKTFCALETSGGAGRSRG